MRGCRVLAVAIGCAVLLGLLAMASEETFRNDSGKRAEGIRVTFSKSVTITNYDKGVFPDKAPAGQAQVFTFSGGSCASQGKFSVTWSPGSATMSGVEWLQGNAASFQASLPGAEVPGTSAITDIDAFLAECPPDDELAILRADFPVVYDPPMRVPPVYTCTPGLDADVMEELAVYRALRVIRHMKLSEPLPWTELHPYEWLKSQVGAIVISSLTPYSACCRPVNVPGHWHLETAIILKSSYEEMHEYWRVWIDPQSGVGLCGLVGLLLHEARHADGTVHTCEAGDATLAEMGAWGVQYTIFKWMLEGKVAIGIRSVHDRMWLETYVRDARERICE